MPIPSRPADPQESLAPPRRHDMPGAGAPLARSARRRPGSIAILAALVLLACLAPSCAPSAESPETAAGPSRAHGPDPHSWSNPDEVVVTHHEFDLAVDFDARRIEGTVHLDLDRSGGGSELVLDTNALEIRDVRLDAGEAGSFRLGPAGEHAWMGRPLVVPLAPETTRVSVDYATSPGAVALQWLEPEQTSSGRAPFLYTQGQAILTRSWMPCQDTPGVRITYGGSVTVPEGLLAVMSAENPTEVSPDGRYTFRMPQPVPPYLLALAAGELEFRPLGPRSGVYAEPSVVEAAAAEFSGTEAMMDTTEAMYGPYRWERFDMLVLPPSFPWGGMENPRLTFLTPTIIAGDSSLTALVVHELAHSWSGNLVTNAAWSDLWLNEGFTVYVERRVSEALHGREHAEMLWLLGLQDLKAELESLGADDPDTRLALEAEGRDPDDVFTDVAYEKGSLFLRALEEAVGRDAFDAFLRGYFDAHDFRSISTARFESYLAEHLDGYDAVDVEAWIHGPGLPGSAPVIVSDAFERVDAEVAKWRDGAAPASLATDGWNAQQWLHFLRALPDAIEAPRMDALDAAFGFTASGNSELHSEWLRHAIASDYAPAYDALESFLVRQGRRKFLRPLYGELAKTPGGLERARRIYERARPGYHSVSRGTIDELLGWSGESS